MIKINLLLTASLLLAGCASPSPCVQIPKPEPVKTEAPEYFQTEWKRYLTNFKAGLEALSKGAHK